MEKIFTPDTITVIRKKGDDYELEQIPTRKTLRGAKLTNDQAQEVTISQLRKDPSVLVILEGDENYCTAKATLGEEMELTLILKGGEKPEGRVETTAQKDDNCSTGVFFSMTGTPEERDKVFNKALDCAMHILINSEQENECPQMSGGPDSIMFTIQAREALEEAGHQVEGFLAADVDFEPFMLVHENDIVLIGSEHFNGYNLFVEVKRLFIGASEDEMQQAAKKTEKGNDIEAIHCADGSWSFRKPLNISCHENFLDDLETTINDLKQAIVHVGNEPDVEGRIEVQRQLFTWEVLDAVVKFKQLPM